MPVRHCGGESVVRHAALDGLRGVAALVVVIHHSLLMVAVLATPYYSYAPAAEPGTLPWWLTHTPLHLVWEGSGAVYVFFVLSGFVLTLPVLRGGYDWVAYYPQRLIRLYLPVWGALLFAVATFFLIPRTETVSSAWLAYHPREVGRGALLKDAALVLDAGWHASPLWSLAWEVLFSLALPVVIWVAVKLRRTHVLVVVASMAVTTLGGVLEEPSLMYLPMFVIGVILAFNQDVIRGWASRLRTPGWIGLTVLAVFGLTSRWLIMAFGAPRPLIGATIGLALVAAAYFVLMAMTWSAARRIFEARPLRTLGRLSFSLYLVHEPIVVAAGFAFPDNPIVAIPVALAIIAVVTPLFYVAVERPSHRLAVTVGRAVRSRRSRSAKRLDPGPDVPESVPS